MLARKTERRYRRGGFSATELVAVTGVFGMVLVFLFQAIGLADNVFRKSQTAGIGLKEARLAVEAVMSDVRTATRSLARYPTTGEAQFFADEETTVILFVPERRADGSLDHSRGTVKIYSLEAIDGPEGPYRLVVREAGVVGAVEGQPAAARVVAKQINGAQFPQSTEETFYGDAETQAFGLVAPALGSTDHLDQHVLVGGKDRLNDGLAAIDTTKLIFAKAPKAQVPIDVHYRVEPGMVAGTHGANAATSVTLFVEFRQVWRSAKAQGQARPMQFLTRNALLNK